jgi:alpha-beta hydrolase superfamily lysophospholipase
MDKRFDHGRERIGSLPRGEVTLFYTAVAPSPPLISRATLVIVHGLSEHGGRYHKLQGELAQKGFSSWAYDQRGFGKSTGRRTYVTDYHELLDDLQAVIDAVRTTLPPAEPLLLIGHSLGGAVVATFCINAPRAVDGIVLSAPAYEIVPFPATIHYLGILANLFLPTISIRYPGGGDNLSHDPEVKQSFHRDPLVQSAGTPRFYHQFRKMNGYLRCEAHRITVPTLILQGTADTTVVPEGARRLHQKISAENKQIIFYDQFYHEPFNEIGRDRVISNMVGWIDDLLLPPPPSSLT